MLISDFFGFVEVILGLVNASYSLPEGQAVKLSLHLEGSSGSWKSGKGFFFDFQFLGNDCLSWECVNLRECQVIEMWMEKNSFWRTVGKIWLWVRNWALELLILNLRIPHCLAFSYPEILSLTLHSVIIFRQNLVYLECLFKINCKMTKWGMKKHQYHLFILR